MVMEAPKQRTNTGRVPGFNVLTPHYDLVSSDAVPVYVDTGENEIEVSFAGAPSGANSWVADDTSGSLFMQYTVDVTFITPPSQTMEIVQFRNASGKVGSILVWVSGGLPQLVVRGGGDVQLWTAGAGTLALNVRYRVFVTMQVATITTGKMKGQVVRVSDGVTVVSGERTDLNNGTVNLTRVQVGKISGSGTVGLLIDNSALFDSAYAYINAASDPPEIPEEGPAGNERAHTFLGRVPGEEVGTDEFDQVAGNAAQRVYASLGGGRRAARFGAAGAGTNGFVVNVVTPTNKLSFAAKITLRALASANQEILTSRSAVPSNVGFSVVALTTGRIRVNIGDGSQTVFTSPVMTLDTEYTLQVAADVAGGVAGEGKLRARMLTAAGDLFGSPGERRDLTHPNVLINSYRFGKTATASSILIDFANVRSYDASYGWIEPAPELPEAGPDMTVEPETVFTRAGLGPGTWTLVDNDGEPSLDWEQVGQDLIVRPHGTDGQREYVFGWSGDTFTLTVPTVTEFINGAPAIFEVWDAP